MLPCLPRYSGCQGLGGALRQMTSDEFEAVIGQRPSVNAKCPMVKRIRAIRVICYIRGTILTLLHEAVLFFSFMFASLI
jgi:hypothetical protein